MRLPRKFEWGATYLVDLATSCLLVCFVNSDIVQWHRHKLSAELGYHPVLHPHFLQLWYPGVALSLFLWHLCRAQNDRLRAGLFFFIVMFGSPNRTHLPLTSFANFLFLPGEQLRFFPPPASCALYTAILLFSMRRATKLRRPIFCSSFRIHCLVNLKNNIASTICMFLRLWHGTMKINAGQKQTSTCKRPTHLA